MQSETIMIRAHSMVFQVLSWQRFQTFSELVDAASKGDPRGVDQHSDDLVETMDAVEGEDSWYTVCADETSKAASMLVFCFGKAVGSDIGITVASCLVLRRP